jgi:hypothetical protein
MNGLTVQTADALEILCVCRLDNKSNSATRRAGGEREEPAGPWRRPPRGGAACARRAPGPSRTRRRRSGTRGSPRASPSWSSSRPQKPCRVRRAPGLARGRGGRAGGWCGGRPAPGTSRMSDCRSCTRTRRLRGAGASWRAPGRRGPARGSRCRLSGASSFCPQLAGPGGAAAAAGVKGRKAGADTLTKNGRWMEDELRACCCFGPDRACPRPFIHRRGGESWEHALEY